MSDEKNLENAKPETETQPTATTPVTTGGETFTKEQVEQIVKERLQREKAAAEKKQLEAAAKAAEEAAAKNGEWEKVAKAKEAELAELQAALKAKELADLKRTVAEKVGLPLQLAARLVGETEADIEKDAKTLLDTLPKPAKPSAGAIPNPGGNATTGETLDQRLKRLGLR